MSNAAELAIILPAHNEAGYLEAAAFELIAALRHDGKSFEIHIVENGSRDATMAVGRRLEREFAEIRLHHLSRPDYGSAQKYGLLATEAPLAVLFDVDYYDVDFMRQAVSILTSDNAPAIVVGSKRAAGSSDNRSWTRRAVTWGFTTLLRKGFGMKVSDTHGIKAVSREKVIPYVKATKFGRDLFDTEMILRAERGGLLVADVPVVVEEKRPSRTSIFRRVPRTVLGLSKMWFVLRWEYARK